MAVHHYAQHLLEMRLFESGGTRDTDEGKVDPEGCLSAITLQKFCEYMLAHTTQADGQKRSSENWQRHFGEDHYAVCMKSFMRHAFDLWLAHRKLPNREGLEAALHGCMFNLMAFGDKYYKEKIPQEVPQAS